MHAVGFLFVYIIVIVVVLYLCHLSLPKTNLENFNLLKKLLVAKYRKVKLRKVSYALYSCILWRILTKLWEQEEKVRAIGGCCKTSLYR